MAQMIQRMISDQTSAVAGTVTFTLNPGPGGYTWDDVVVVVTAATAASGAYSVTLTRDDASTVLLSSFTGLAAAAADWRLSVGPHVNVAGMVANSPFTVPLTSKSLVWSATAGAGGTVRLTLWGVKYQGT